MDRLICVLGALREEIKLIRGQMTITEQFKLGRADAWTGCWEDVPILLVRTGIGKDCAIEALEKVLSRVNPSLIFSIGYAGGLDPKLTVGDLILADQVLKINAAHVDVGSYPIDLKKIELLEGMVYLKKIAVYRGKLITVDQVIADSATKAKLGSLYNALAVDMETAALIDHATKKNISILSVRAISDTFEQSLLNVSSLLGDDGEVSRIKAGWYVITHPHRIKNLICLREQSEKATRNMTEFLRVFLHKYHRLA